MTKDRPNERRQSESTDSGPQAALTGWVVFRPQPWDIVGIFGSREEAELQREHAGAGYQVAFGTADVASGQFEPPTE